MVSQGIPMVLGGDELSRTQKGNNNAFCQDNEISWFDWKLDERKINFLKFFKEAIKFRKENKISKSEYIINSFIWLNKDGNLVDETTWKSPTKFVAFIIKDLGILTILNSSNENIKFKLPEGKWKLILSSEIGKEEIAEKELLVELKSSLIYKKL